MSQRTRHLLCFLIVASVTPSWAEERPNVLWITSEDNSPLLGCYGDKQASTPNLDRLAAEGVLYDSAFANAPVCSAARSTLILGMYPPAVGLQHHRSRYRVPEAFKKYGEYLREAGYYCTNNSKKDYNLDRPGQPEWDESSNRAHYKNRKSGQPFFAVFNLGTSHESTPQNAAKMRRSGVLPARPRLTHESIEIPPYHPREPDIVDEWVNYYDDVTLMDRQAGDILKELGEQGVADDTIVFYFSDHGGALPRGKRYLYDSGTRVPLIVRFPAKWKDLASAKPGEVVSRLVSFVDLPPTVLSLAKVPIPAHMQGRPFLGSQQKPAAPYVFLFRGRMDERYDFARAVRDDRFRYIRNFSPHLPCGQHYAYPFQVLKSMGAWYEAYRAGRCNAEQAAFWEPKSSEELYDIRTDPWELRNLAADPQYVSRRDTLRKALFDTMLSIRDTGFIPESLFGELAGEATIYEYAHSDHYPLEEILTVADLATSRNVESLPLLLEAMGHEHPVIRYWGAMGAVVLGMKAKAAKDRLTKLLSDRYAAVRIAAARALGQIQDRGTALDALRAEITSRASPTEMLEALNALETLRPLDSSFVSILKSPNLGVAGRIAESLLEDIR